MSYININSIRNKLDDPSTIVSNNIDVLCIAETKLDNSFPEPQFFLKGYKKPYRLDVSDSSGGLLTYVNSDIPSTRLTSYTFPKDIQCLVIELNLRKQKWLVFSIYRNPAQDLQYFLNNLSLAMDFYASKYENTIILGDFDNTPSSADISSFMADFSLYSLINKPTCFKSRDGRCIDLILTTKKHNFQKSQSFETGLSDYHHMIYTMLKTTFKRIPPKTVTYRCYRKFSEDAFRSDLQKNLWNSHSGNFSSLHTVISLTLDHHAPIKKKLIRGNSKPHVRKDLRKAIMKRSRLKNIFNKTRNINDFTAYKKQRNLVVNMNRKAKRKFFETVESTKNGKQFWNKCKPYFTNKCVSDETISLLENKKIIQDDKAVAEIFND